MAVTRAVAVLAAGALTLLGATVGPSVTPAHAADVVLYEANFDGLTAVPGDVAVHAGTWAVENGRLVGTSVAGARTRVSFGPAAPQHFKFESTVHFESVTDPSRWINFGMDYHAAADYGAVAVMRSKTSVSNGLELAQKSTPTGTWVSSPVTGAFEDIGVGEDHLIEVEVHGNQFVLRMDGVAIMAGTNLIRVGGSFGFVVNNSKVQFDNIKITELESNNAPEFIVDGGYPVLIDAGGWPAGHIQGVAYDPVNKVFYHSFTTMLIKTDLDGTVLGTLGGWTGHLGDLDFGDDGLIYGSLEYKEQNTFYIAVIDGDKITGPGQMLASDPSVFQTVFLPEATDDYVWDATGNGFAGNTGATDDHRFGASGIDGVSFGPAFGSTTGDRLLTVAYGIYSNTSRTDNDYQVLLQYDTSDWSQYWTPLNEGAPHLNGPASTDAGGYGGKYFIHTGNTSFGVQNLEYDEHLQRWWMPVYVGSKPEFPNYSLFAVDAATPPVVQDLVGQPVPTQGAVIALANDGLTHAATGIRGWNFTGSVGFQGVGDGLYYVATSGASGGLQLATLRLVQWSGDSATPFPNALGAFRVAPSALTEPAATTTTAGVPFAGVFDAAGTGHAAYRVTAGALPAGVTLVAATGELIGAPTVAGSYPVTVEAYNGHADTVTVQSTLVVDPAAPASITPSVNATEFAIGDTPTLSAVIEDAYGNVITGGWAVTSSVVDDIVGTAFSPVSAGPRTLTFTFGAVSATLDLVVQAADQGGTAPPVTEQPGVSGLPTTGADNVPGFVAAALALLIAGGGFLMLRRRAGWGSRN